MKTGEWWFKPLYKSIARYSKLLWYRNRIFVLGATLPNALIFALAFPHIVFKSFSKLSLPSICTPTSFYHSFQFVLYLYLHDMYFLFSTTYCNMAFIRITLYLVIIKPFKTSNLKIFWRLSNRFDGFSLNVGRIFVPTAHSIITV